MKKMKKSTPKRKFNAIMSLVILAVCLYPWIFAGGQHYNSIVYFVRLLRGGCVDVLYSDLTVLAGAGEITRQSIASAAWALLIQLGLMNGIVVLDVIYLVMTLLKKRFANMILNMSVVVSLMSYLMMTEGSLQAFGGLKNVLYPAAIVILILTNFLGGMMVANWNEASRLEKERMAAEKAARKEKKERLRFDGKYSKAFYTMVWKNFKYSFKDYRILLCAGILSVSMLFVGSGMREMMSAMDRNGSLLAGRGMDAILLNFAVVFLILTAALITSILVFYLKNRMRNFGVFVTLGIRRRTLYFFIAIELAACVLLSFAGGLIVGNVLMLVFRKLTETVLGARIILGALTWKTYRMTFGMTILVFLAAFLVTYGLSTETNVTKMKDENIRKEKLPGRFCLPGLAAGILLLAFFFRRFSKIESAEGITSLAGVFLGLFYVLQNGWGLWLRRRKKQEKRYYDHLISENQMYHKFRKTNRYIFLLSVIHICALVICAKTLVTSVIAPEPEKLLPYDYVCLATEEDDGFFEQMAEKGAGIKSYPMVRVTSVDRTPYMELDDYRRPIRPQGQNIGISESVYRELKKELGEEVPELPKLDAAGRNIYVVYQQDISEDAKPLDYFLTRTKPYLHIGQPLGGYYWVKREQIYPKRIVAGSERGSLVGTLREGIHENVVVFSDAYFEKVKDNWKKENWFTGEPVEEASAVEGGDIHHWPTKLVLVNRGNAKAQDIETILREYKKNHAVDEKFSSIVHSYYVKTEVAEEMESGRLLKELVNGFIVTLLAIISIFVLYLKVESEMPDIYHKYEFLNYMGMPKKERIRSIRTEINRFWWMPMWITAVSVAVLTAIIWHLRQFVTAECIRYAKVFGIVAAAYALVQIIAVKLLERYVVRKVEG